jgi:succinate-semialdehyde dehydrogenase/glutarate-semialdehyde dehydrogenase
MLKNTSLLKAHGFINGQWVGDDAQSRFDVTNAYTNEVISTLP